MGAKAPQPKPKGEVRPDPPPKPPAKQPTAPVEVTTRDFTARALQWRGVDTPCDNCGGSGVIMYSSTSTWRRGGVAGRALTQDVCSTCWGTGDKHRTGADLRKITRYVEHLKHYMNKDTRAQATEAWEELNND